MLRIFQEALTNVARHADATKVTVVLKRTIRRLNMEIGNNGKGFQNADITSPLPLGLMAGASGYLTKAERR